MCVMKPRAKKEIPQERDRHLGVPAEANRDKHINFLEVEERQGSDERNSDDSPLYIPDSTRRRDGSPEGDHRA